MMATLPKQKNIGKIKIHSAKIDRVDEITNWDKIIRALKKVIDK